MPNKDYYHVLGVPKNASQDEIKKAFRRLAHEHHPDKGGEAQRFKDINEAYQILGDAKKRSTYDQFGSAAFDPNAGMHGGGFDPSGFHVNMDGDFGDLGDILGGMFGFGGRRGSRAGQTKGRDVEVDVAIEFLDSVKGVEKAVSLLLHGPCSTCGGGGAAPGSPLKTCKTCQGSGQVQHMQRTILGAFQTAVICGDCQGRGQIPETPCASCKGKGVERKQKDLRVPIPAGIDDGETLRVEGEGEYPGPGGRSGDLYLHIRVKPHPVFSRQVNDIVSTVSVPYSTLSLGGAIDIQTVDGPATLKIPEATEPGTVFKLRGKGIPFTRSSGRGDHLVTVMPEVKKKLTREQRQILEKLKEAGL